MPCASQDSCHARVQAALAQRVPLTLKQIREATGLPRRSVYGALCKLREKGLLGERASLRDTRQTYFWLKAPGSETAPVPAPMVA